MARLATTTWNEHGDTIEGAPANGAAPLAVLLHGVTSSASSAWYRVGPALVERGWNVVALDLRGHGASPRGTPGMGIPDLADDVAETVRTVRETIGGPAADASGPGAADASGDGIAVEPGDGSTAPVVDLLIGHSLGALTAMTLLCAEPDFARLAVLEDPPCREAADWPAEAERIGRDVHLARTDPDTLLAELKAPPSNLDDREAADKLEAMRALDLETLQTVLRGGMTFDVAALARGVAVPTLLFLGQPDRGSLLVGEARAATATGLAKGWSEVVPCGHSVHREAYDSYMRRLDAWLDRVNATSGSGSGSGSEPGSGGRAAS